LKALKHVKVKVETGTIQCSFDSGTCKFTWVDPRITENETLIDFISLKLSSFRREKEVEIINKD